MTSNNGNDKEPDKHILFYFSKEWGGGEIHEKRKNPSTEVTSKVQCEYGPLNINTDLPSTSETREAAKKLKKWKITRTGSHIMQRHVDKGINIHAFGLYSSLGLGQQPKYHQTGNSLIRIFKKGDATEPGNWRCKFTVNTH